MSQVEFPSIVGFAMPGLRPSEVYSLCLWLPVSVHQLEALDREWRAGGAETGITLLFACCSRHHLPSNWSLSPPQQLFPASNSCSESPNQPHTLRRPSYKPQGTRVARLLGSDIPQCPFLSSSDSGHFL